MMKIWVFKKLSKFCKSTMLKLVVYFVTLKKKIQPQPLQLTYSSILHNFL